MKLFGGYTPSPRSMHGIIDGLGPIVAKYMTTLPAPDDDGEVLVIELGWVGRVIRAIEGQMTKDERKKGTVLGCRLAAVLRSPPCVG